MAIEDPDNLYFTHWSAGGASEISLERAVDSADWTAGIVENDEYLWSYGNRRTFWSFGDRASAIERYQATPAPATVLQPLFSISEGRSDILCRYDVEQMTLTAHAYTLAGVSIVSANVAVGARAQGTLTLSNVAATSTDGYIDIIVSPALSNTTASIYSLKLIEQRIALADL